MVFVLCVNLILCAQTNIDSLLQLLKKNNSPKGQIDIYNKLSDKFRVNNLDTALYFGNQANKLATDIKYVEGQIESMNNLSLCFLSHSKFDTALVLSNKAIELCQQNNKLAFYARCYTTKADVFEYLNYGDSADYYYTLATQYANDDPNKLTLAAIYNNHANHFESRNEYDKALDYYLKALAIFKEAGERGKEATIIANIGNIYSFRKQNELAMEQFNEALSINTELNNLDAMAKDYSNLGITYRNLNQYDKSIENSLKALEINKKLKNKGEQVKVYYNLGVTYDVMNEPDKALVNYEQSLELSKEIGFEMGVLYNTYGMGLLYAKRNDKNLADKHLKYALLLSQQFHMPVAGLNCYQELYRLNKKNKKYQDALLFFEKYQSMKDSIFTVDRERTVADLQTKYETEKKESLIAELKHKEEVNRLTLRTIILFFVLLALGSAFMVFYYQKRKVIYRQKLTIQQQEIDKMQMVQSANRQELTSKALMLAKSEEIILRFRNEIEQVLPKTDSNTSHELKTILHRVQWNENSKEQWKDFVARFDELNNGFIGKLIERYPNLSPVELRLCAMLRLQLSTKDIADLSNRSIRTVENTRTNIRKKMNLGPTENLTTYLLNI
jgi:tetratricopeptide (TPR) repeat protein/DNA-binding NarL/FixJ family response regulator